MNFKKKKELFHAFRFQNQFDFDAFFTLLAKNSFC